MRDYDYIAKYKSYAYRIKEYDKLMNKENVNMKLKIKYLDGAKELVSNKKGDLIDVYGIWNGKFRICIRITRRPYG